MHSRISSYCRVGTAVVVPWDAAEGMSIQSSYANCAAIAKRSNSYHGLCATQVAAAIMEY